MLRALISVSGFTLLSRISGFARDVLMAATMGAGPMSDAFQVALRLPNNFRAIFAEGAFNAAFVPLYTKLRTEGGEDAAKRFADDMLSWQFIIQIGLLVVALIAMPLVVAMLAPGFTSRPEQMELAVALTRITFGYLLCVTIVTQLSAMLNARGFFKIAAAAPILLNIGVMTGLAMAFLFPSAAHAAAWGVLAGGIAEVLVLLLAIKAAGLKVRLNRPAASPDVRRFLSTFGPAVVGSAGVQIGLFADTILASYLAAGELTSLYFADRINQLPLGVIGVALGTVLLPEMSRRIAAGDIAGSSTAQNRAAELGLLLTLPCLALFLIMPDLIMLGLFSRGAFNADAAAAAASVLSVYAVGLPAFILIRTVTPLFHARGDTKTPVRATLISIAVNLSVKVGLIWGLGWGAEGLAAGTVVGAFVNLGVLLFLAQGQGLLSIGRRLRVRTGYVALATAGMAIAVYAAQGPVLEAVTTLSRFRNEAALVALGAFSLIVYGLGAWGFGLLQRR